MNRIPAENQSESILKGVCDDIQHFLDADHEHQPELLQTAVSAIEWILGKRRDAHRTLTFAEFCRMNQVPPKRLRTLLFGSFTKHWTPTAVALVQDRIGEHMQHVYDTPRAFVRRLKSHCCE